MRFIFLALFLTLQAQAETFKITIPAQTITVDIQPVPSATPSVTPSSSPSPVPSPSPSPSVIPSPSPTSSTSVQILDTFERPEFSQEAQWKNQITRTILDGQTTSVVFRSLNPCGLVSLAGIQKLMPYTTVKSSAPSYPTGTFYDAMVPLSASNCSGSKYLQLDLNSTQSIGDAKVTVIKKVTKAPVNPTIPLAMEFNNWIMVQGYCGGVYCNAETSALQGLQLLKDHRISPYKGVPADTQAFWKDYVQNMSQGVNYMGWSTSSNWLSAQAQVPNAYAYVIDEPAIGSDFTAQLNTWLAYPWIKPMMTGPLRQRDFRPTSPTYGKLQDWPAAVKSGIKIFTAVAEQFCAETWAGSGESYACKSDYDAAQKEVWLYVSNMSHGNEGSAASGAPDLVIDRSAVEPFGFYLLALKYDVKNLLYYNSIEGWQAIKTRDVWADAYQFGGQGDGLLLMPDRANKKALPTMRLKLLREASQFADIVIIAGLQNEAKTLVTNTTKWDHSLSKIEALRTKALGLIQ